MAIGVGDRISDSNRMKKIDLEQTTGARLVRMGGTFLLVTALLGGCSEPLTNGPFQAT